MILNEIIDHIDFKKGLKLTKTGNLPVRIVKEIYSKRIILDVPIEIGITKLSKETDFLALNCAKIIGIMSGYLRKANNKIYVTKKGQEFKNSDNNLRDILFNFGIKFNKGYYDGYEDDFISQRDFIFSIYLLSKYGQDKKETDFYAKKYFEAFPTFGQDIKNKDHCYILRTFDRFFAFLGFLDIIQESNKSILVDQNCLINI